MRFLGFIGAIFLGACAHVDISKEASMVEVLESPKARLMWVAAHPDDESMAGALLARACIGLERPCYFFVLNHGDGGECLLKNGCKPDLATVRGTEMKRAALAYGAQLEHHRFYNAPLPMESFPKRHEIAARWKKKADPTKLIAEAIERFKPTVLVTFDPRHGFTGHPEHQLASRFAMAAVRQAKHKVQNVFIFLNRYWPYRMAFANDPAIPTELFDSHQGCGAPMRPCLDVALNITRAHRSQASDMALLRSVRPLLGEVYLRRIDVSSEEEAPSPDEVAQ